MRCAIVAFNNLSVSPYVKIYSDWLDAHGVEFHFIYLDRESLGERLGAVSYPLPYDKSKSKIVNFIRFRRMATKLLKKGAYDFVFVMPTFPAVLLSGVLKRHYRGRYLVDVRDPTYEGNAFYFALEKRVMKHAAMRVVSSRGYEKILPKADYVFCPNVSASERVPKYKFSHTGSAERMRITYVGSISYLDSCRRLISLVAKDDRFYLDIHGSEAHEGVVEGYVREAACDRIRYHGRYAPCEKADIILASDVLFNAYAVKENLAFSNKLYDSMFFKKPLLCDPDSVMIRDCDVYAYPFDYEDEGVLDGLINWYLAIDADSYDSFADGYLEGAYADLDYFYERLEKTVLEGGR